MSDDRSYAVPRAGLPPQTDRTVDRAVFKTAYAFLPNRTMSDITASSFPHWNNTRGWILARPMTGFSETFAQYAMEVAPGGGSDRPEPDADAEGVLFVLRGGATLTVDSQSHELTPGSFVYLTPGASWTLHNKGREPVSFQWIRKRYQYVDGVQPPASFVTHDNDVPVQWMPDTNDSWGTTRFVEPDDLAHDMHVTIVSLRPGAVIPFSETHVMEHGLYVLQGKAVYQLNEDWVEVEAGDFMWLRAFCPQACYTGGPGIFRYLLYKDMHRHPALSLY